MYKILQIMPVRQPSWEAMFLQKEDASYRAVALVGWALIEKELGGSRFQDVVGLLPATDHGALATVIDEEESFLGYHYPHCATNWVEEARKRWIERYGDR